MVLTISRVQKSRLLFKTLSKHTPIDRSWRVKHKYVLTIDKSWELLNFLYQPTFSYGLQICNIRILFESSFETLNVKIFWWEVRLAQKRTYLCLTRQNLSIGVYLLKVQLILLHNNCKSMQRLFFILSVLSFLI